MLPRATLGRLEPLAKGGTARIYRLPDFRIPGADGLVYKEYTVKVRAQAGPALLHGLLALTEFRERLAEEQRSRVDERVIWPLRVVTGEDAGVAGIVMRLIPADFFQPLQLRSGNTKTKPREVCLLFGEEKDSQRLGLPPSPLRLRLAICARIAATYALLHRAGVIVGDVSGRNVLYTVDTPPRILVVDADSARVKGTRSAFGAQPHTPLWEPPEALGAKRQIDRAQRSGSADPGRMRRLEDDWIRQNKATDVYKFGLMVVRLLDYGRYRTSNRDPGRACQILRQAVGRQTADLLLRSLDQAPANRPEMREWYAALRGRGAPPGAAAGTERTSAPAQSGPRVRTVGSWSWVDGKGWVRNGS